MRTQKNIFGRPTRQANLLVTILFTFFALAATAQKNKRKSVDSTLAIKEFMTVCNQYKKLPLQLSLKHTAAATIPVSAEDTSTIEADFFMDGTGAYIKYGLLEQVVSDSFMLMINGQQQVMMLYPLSQGIQAQLGSYLGLHMADSSAHKLAARYSSSFLPTEEKGKGVIELRNRIPLAGTDIIKEIISIRYDVNTKEPQQVSQTRRTLVPIDKADFERLQHRQDIADKLVKIKDDYFIVNERRSVFDYKRITHNSEVKVPVRISDRLAKNALGKYVPAKGFEEYYLSVE